MNRKMLVLDPEKCVGCHTCEMVCSLKHHGACSRTRSRITVITQDTQDNSIPIMCQHCERPVCESVCPVNAVSRDQATHAMLIEKSRCLGCKMCIFVCPFGAPSLDPLERITIKCDLCDGDPICARLCPTEAIQFIREDKMGMVKKRKGLERLACVIGEMIQEK